MFIDDNEKMRDIFILPKNEFLDSYSYLTEEEYDETMQAVNNMTIKVSDVHELIGRFMDEFEDYLDKKSVNSTASVHLRGEEYDDLAFRLWNVLKGWNKP